MQIINVGFSFKNVLVKRTKTEGIVLHHAAATKCTVEDIHAWHLANGWAGIGYHFFVRKDGTVYSGRPIDTVGAHTVGMNDKSVGICFEGNFEKEEMPEAQKKAGAELVTYVIGIYPGVEISKHKDHNATACPGKNFPFNYIAKGVITKPEAPKETPKNEGVLYQVNNETIIKDPTKVQHTGKGIFTIVEEMTVSDVRYGRLKSGVGWIRLDDAKKM